MVGVSSQELPWVVRAMQNKIRGLHAVGKSYEAAPVSGTYDRIIVQSTSSVFDPVWEFSGVMSILDGPVPKEMIGLCKLLKNTECELEWKGIVFKKPFFKSLSGLLGLRNYIPSISQDTRLADMLNSTPRIMSLLEKIRPDTVLVTFSTMPVFDFNVPKETILKLMAESYENPQNLVAVIKLRKLLTQGLSGPSTVSNILEVVEEMSQVVRRISQCGLPQ